MEFAYEKLDVWKRAVDFGMKVIAMAVEKTEDRKAAAVIQAAWKSALHSSTAIAKGKGYTSKNDFAQHLYLSRGSVYETMTLLKILKRKQVISGEQYTEFEKMGNQVVAMVSGLVRSLFAIDEKKRGPKE
ncbi:MAG: four helix bundle protein [Deltaproteobacteria bacterium]|jgi:four helix bundle protein|nr:four helix bundle protein [Deltaproteobacteria bacterium]